MAKRPLVAIVGRPNVGKSLLFNRLCGKRLSIVEDTPGVTRDRLYAACEWAGRTFDIVDTGGIEPTADSEILLFMREQAEIAISTATVWQRSSATGGVASRRSSSCVVVSTTFAPGTSQLTSFSSSPEQGSSSAVQRMLK